ncbi:hypothetical protein HPB50_008469 [Hyalomma asiaticum]|uniref:Uncharacterized protein n=1 Tax=Hyalomma asiaticum TaxID=266040 RepID=A0ACB7RXN8_HYAAI|nr:hypothetical protein HPB50_008469 [Hyalomma asiaticum]
MRLRDGAGNLASDHHRIQLVFQNGFRRCQTEPPVTPRRPNEKALQQMAAKREEHANLIESYGELVEEFQKVLNQWESCTRRRRGLQPWWNREVAEAIRRRQEASRACIRTANRRFVEELRSAGVQAPQHFWQYIKRRNWRTP